jgi:hypothetical protein
MRSKTRLIPAFLFVSATILLPGALACVLVAGCVSRFGTSAMAAPGLTHIVLRVEGMR